MKSVLIIDKPNSCYACPCYRQNHYGFEDCKATYMPLSPAEVDDIPEWCPLRPLPQKKKEEPVGGLFAKGWNKCLEELKKC